jgi:hypothetical protein
MMTTSFWDILLVLITALLAAVGQLFFKWGAGSISSNLWDWVLNWSLIVGLGILCWPQVTSGLPCCRYGIWASPSRPPNG